MGGAGTGSPIGSALTGAAISTLITELRTDLSDDNSTRYTDTQLLNLFKKAIRRANRIVQRNGIQFAKKSVTLTTVASQDYVSLALYCADFDVFIGLYDDTSHDEIPRRNEREWETDAVAPALTYCHLDQTNSKIYFNGTPTEAVNLSLWYYPTVDPSAYTVSSTTPWDGRLDDIIMEYVGIRAKNIDEMNASFDQKLLEDMENQIIQAYLPNSPTMSEGTGWMD